MKKPASAKHVRLHEALKKSIVHAITDEMPLDEVLTVTSKVVGMLIGMQDQRAGKDAIMEIVVRNIEEGNQDYIKVVFADIVGGKQ